MKAPVVRLVTVAIVLGLVAAPAAAGRYRHGRHHGYTSYHHHRSGGGFALGFGLGLLTGVIDARPRYVERVYDPYPAGYVVVDRRERSQGSIETDVRPDGAAVYLDGRPVGIADDFNGWPSRLDVAPGRHQLLFREPGYRSLEVTVDVLPGHTVRIDERMERGVDDAEREVLPREPRTSLEPVPRAGDAGAATLVLDVNVEGASIFIDGRRRDRGSEGRSVRLEVTAGSHRIEVVKPGYDSFEGEVAVGAGQLEELSVRLQPRS